MLYVAEAYLLDMRAARSRMLTLPSLSSILKSQLPALAHAPAKVRVPDEINVLAMQVPTQLVSVVRFP